MSIADSVPSSNDIDKMIQEILVWNETNLAWTKMETTNKY